MDWGADDTTVLSAAQDGSLHPRFARCGVCYVRCCLMLCCVWLCVCGCVGCRLAHYLERSHKQQAGCHQSAFFVGDELCHVPQGHFGRPLARFARPPAVALAGGSQRGLCVCVCGVQTASGGLDNLLTIYKLPDSGASSNGELKYHKELAHHTGYISGAVFLDEAKVISASGDQQCVLWVRLSF